MANAENLDQLSRSPLGVAQDGVLAGGLISASAWGPWLAELNQVLTAVSLAIGVVLGSARLWLLFKERNKPLR
jgi:hypothetical protein